MAEPIIKKRYIEIAVITLIIIAVVNRIDTIKGIIYGAGAA